MGYNTYVLVRKMPLDDVKAFYFQLDARKTREAIEIAKKENRWVPNKLSTYLHSDPKKKKSGSSSSSSNVVDLVSEDEDDELLHPQIIASSSTVTPHVHVWNVGDPVSPNGQSRFDRINDTSMGTIIGVRDMSNMGDGMRLDIIWDVNDREGRAIRALFRYEEVIPSYDVGDYVACKDSPLRGYVTEVMVTTTVCHRVRWIKFVDSNVPGWSDVNHQDIKREDELVYWDGKVWDGTAMTPLNDEEPTITPHANLDSDDSDDSDDDDGDDSNDSNDSGEIKLKYHIGKTE
mgnify:FL=1